jgi:nitrogen fixation-related uncharacterized protein
MIWHGKPPTPLVTVALAIGVVIVWLLWGGWYRKKGEEDEGEP